MPVEISQQFRICCFIANLRGGISRLLVLAGKQLVAVFQQLWFEVLRVKGLYHFLSQSHGRTTLVLIQSGESVPPGLLSYCC